MSRVSNVSSVIGTSLSRDVVMLFILLYIWGSAEDTRAFEARVASSRSGNASEGEFRVPAKDARNGNHWSMLRYSPGCRLIQHVYPMLLVLLLTTVL